MTTRRVMGIETEYGVSVPGEPAVRKSSIGGIAPGDPETGADGREVDLSGYAKITNVPAATAHLYKTETEFNTEATGPDSRRLQQITNDFMEKMKTIPGAVDVGLSEQEPKDELKIELDRGLANSLGISVGDAAQALRVAFAGVEVGDWVDPTGESRDVAVRLHPEDRVDASNIEHLPIAVSGTNMMVPLDQIATVTMGKGPAQIQHLDGKRMIAVSANTQGRQSGEVTADAMKLAKQIDFPQGYGRAALGPVRVETPAAPGWLYAAGDLAEASRRSSKRPQMFGRIASRSKAGENSRTLSSFSPATTVSTSGGPGS